MRRKMQQLEDRLAQQAESPEDLPQPEHSVSPSATDDDRARLGVVFDYHTAHELTDNADEKEKLGGSLEDSQDAWGQSRDLSHASGPYPGTIQVRMSIF